MNSRSPHGTMQLLIEEGCPVAHALIVLSAATAKFVRRDDGWVVEAYTLASVGPSQPESLDLPPNRNVDAQINGRL